jgi:hypothetical protein
VVGGGFQRPSNNQPLVDANRPSLDLHGWQVLFNGDSAAVTTVYAICTW